MFTLFHKKLRNRKGFTLLEIVIVIIVIAILIAIAIPKYSQAAKSAYCTGGLSGFSQLRQAMARCYTMKNSTYVGCTMANLDVDDPGGLTGSNFTYTISGQTAAVYSILADGKNKLTTLVDQMTISQTGVLTGQIGACRSISN